MREPLVSVCIVTWNHANFIEACLKSVLIQTHRRRELVLVDNASDDGTRLILSRYAANAELVFNRQNRGYCGGNNQAIAASRGDFVLLVNPDVVLMPDFIEHAIAAATRDARIGAVCGVLLLGDKDEAAHRVDGTGLCISSSRRMYLRDHGVALEDLSREGGYVFGVDGALALFRRETIEDVSMNGEFFDEMFFAHKEIWDVARRARRLGWKSFFEPRCVATHRRGFKPGSLAVREEQSPSVRMHSVKNDIMTIIKNEDAASFLPNTVPIVSRQLAILFYVILFERTSLRAYAFVLTNLSSILAKRKLIRARQRISAREASKDP